MDVRRLDEMQAQGRSIFDTELAVAYYARVSTDKDEQINSLGNQKRYFEGYIAENPHWTFAGGYVDEGISGTSVEGREQFLKMIEDAKCGRFDLIVTKEISRFARNTLDSLRYTRELLRCGVGVYFQNDNINTFDKDAELRLTIMSSIAQDEVRKLSERTRFGFKRAQENSVLLGQNNLFGYNKVDGRLEIVEPEAAVVREVFERYAAGDLGLRAIANDLDSRGVRGRQGSRFLRLPMISFALSRPSGVRGTKQRCRWGVFSSMWTIAERKVSGHCLPSKNFRAYAKYALTSLCVLPLKNSGLAVTSASTTRTLSLRTRQWTAAIMRSASSRYLPCGCTRWRL